MNLAPIALFVYNRLDHTQETVEALKSNKLANESELFIFSDEAKNENSKEKVKKVRKYIDSVDGFKKITIIKREKNWGLANSIIDGATTILNKYGKIIVLEDDLVTSKNFLRYMNEALEFYKENDKILSITGYNFSEDSMRFPSGYVNDVFVHIRPMSWSWATWKDRWENVIWDMSYFDNFISSFKEISAFNKGGKDLTLMLLDQYAGNIDSWYIRWAYYAFKSKKFTLYPKISLIKNLGFDNSGVHGKSSGKDRFYHKYLDDSFTWKFKKNIEENRSITKNFNKVFSPSLKTRISLRIRLLTKMDKRLNVSKEKK